MSWTAPATVGMAACVGILVYLYVGYPVLIWAVSRLRPRPHRKADVHPYVTVVVPAHNEEAVIGEKLRNCLEQRYPVDRLEVIVASDGSTDATEAIVAACDDPRVRLLRLPRRGKAHAVNAAAAEARSEVLAFTDANAMLLPDSLARLVGGFADPEVGGVCGNKLLRRAEAGDTTEIGEGLYWRYDKWQKRCETRAGSIFASDGALHAVRRELFVPLADAAQADDIAISARVVLQGRRLVFEPDAVVVETAPAEGRDEFRRKVRVTIHSVRALLLLGRGLVASGLYSVELLSHKLLRHFSPLFLLGLLVTSGALVLGAMAGIGDGGAGIGDVGAGAGPPATIGAGRVAPGTAAPGWNSATRIAAVLLALQICFYALAGAGFLLRRTPVGQRAPLSIPYFFCLVNLAALVGLLSILAGARPDRWTPRGGADSSSSVEPQEGAEP